MAIVTINDRSTVRMKEKVSIMKAKVDDNTCIGCGLCEATCPEVFKLNDNDISEVIVNTVPPGAQASCREAAEGCPAEAISIEE